MAANAFLSLFLKSSHAFFTLASRIAESCELASGLVAFFSARANGTIARQTNTIRALFIKFSLGRKGYRQRLLKSMSTSFFAEDKSQAIVIEKSLMRSKYPQSRGF